MGKGIAKSMLAQLAQLVQSIAAASGFSVERELLPSATQLAQPWGPHSDMEIVIRHVPGRHGFA